MLGIKQNHNHNMLKWVLRVAAIFFILLAMTALIFLVFEKTYQNKIYPGVRLGDINLGGKTRIQVAYLINQKINKIDQTGIVFKYNKQQTNLMSVVSSIESDLAYSVIDFEPEDTIAEAISFGRKSNFFQNISDKLKSLIHGKTIEMKFYLNEEEAVKTLANSFNFLEKAPNDAKLVFKSPENIYSKIDAKNFDVLEENFGEVINYGEGIKKLKENLAAMNDSDIELFSQIKNPEIYKKDILNIDGKINKVLGLAPIKLTFLSENKQFNITARDMAPWLVLKNNSAGEGGEKVIIGFDRELIQNYLKKEVSPEIDLPANNAKFEIKDGKVLEFQTSKDGREVNIGLTIEKLESELAGDKNEVEIVVSEVKSNIQMKEVNDFGIKELLGTGQSNFAGSPKNRRHNIAIGASSVNGTLIEPAEEFSLIKTLGDIDKESGYLPELVIKEGRTVPEYGGGLCQIGTTVFRGALSTGLPITLRRNHSYRVSYYEPAGTDATIYDPWPDLRFVNDTGKHILIQSRIEGDNLYFDFWGTNDGRVATTTYPVIYNIVKPAPTKIIETLDLEPGVKKCTEHAHNGADAYFDYTVTYPSEEVKEERFKSHYVPWREVCLLGVEQLSTSTEETIK